MMKDPQAKAEDGPPTALSEATWVVVAAYNEGRSVGKVVREVVATYPNVVVVDDGSRDRTADEAHAAGATVLRHVINRGQGAALQTGLTYALQQGARFVVTFDADGQHSPADVAALLEPLARGEADVSLGSRFLEHRDSVPAGRRLLLLLAVLFTRVMSGMRLTDAHNGLRALSAEAAGRIDLKLDRMAHASEILDQIRANRLRYREVPVHIRYTEYSLSKGQRGTDALRVAFEYVVGRVLR